MTSGPVATFEPLHPAAAAAAAACRGATLARHGRRRGGQERECGQACAARDAHGRDALVPQIQPVDACWLINLRGAMVRGRQGSDAVAPAMYK